MNIADQLAALLREAQQTYLPKPTGINIKRLKTNANFNARVAAVLAAYDTQQEAARIAAIPKCRICGTTENLAPDGRRAWRCPSPDCVPY